MLHIRAFAAEDGNYPTTETQPSMEFSPGTSPVGMGDDNKARTRARRAARKGKGRPRDSLGVDTTISGLASDFATADDPDLDFGGESAWSGSISGTTSSGSGIPSGSASGSGLGSGSGSGAGSSATYYMPLPLSSPMPTPGVEQADVIELQPLPGAGATGYVRGLETTAGVTGELGDKTV